MSVLSDTHELTCNCNWPFAHLLAIIFPLGHSDRDLTINQILLRDYKEKCRSSGGGDASYGGVELAGAATREGADTAGPADDAELAALLAAVEEKDTR